MIISDNRKLTPPVQFIERYDHSRLMDEIKAFNLLDKENWQKINLAEDTDKKLAHIQNKEATYFSKYFNFAEYKYSDLYLNEIDYDLINSSSNEEFVTKRSRVKVLTNKDLLKLQNNSELIFKPTLKEFLKNTYIEEIYNDLSRRFSGGAGRIKIGYMAKNSIIKEHIDGDSSLILKVHIPLVTDSEIKFHVRNKKEVEVFNMPADGSAFLLNVGLPHWVENNSNIDRYHLIINVYTFK